MKTIRDAVEPASGHVLGTSRAPRARTFSVLVVAGYIVLGILAFWPVLPGDPNKLYGTADGDPVAWVWFFAWTAHAVVTGHNPFFTALVNVPSGVNLAQAATMPLLGLVALPVTLIVSPVASATLLMGAAMPLSAVSAYAVLRRWRVWEPAAALGGLAYGFSPYMVDHALFLNLVFVPLPPLIVATLVKVMSRPRRPLGWGAALAGLVVAQFLISSEILALTATISAVGTAAVMVYSLARHRNLIRLSAKPAASALGAAVALAGTALAYPLWYQFAGPAHYVGPAWPVDNEWFADALDFVAPSPHQAFAPVLRDMGTRLSAFAGAEDGVYLGLAVLAGLVCLLWWCRRSVRVRLAAGLAVVSGVLSLGPHLVVDRHGGKVALPFDLLAHLPALDNVLPIRFAFTTDACVAAVMAFALSDIHRRSSHERPVGPPQRQRQGVSRADLAFTVVSVVLVVTWLPTWPYQSQTVSVLPATLTKALPAASPIVLAYPYPISPEDQAYLWQADVRFSFRLLGVYGLVPGVDRRSTEIPPLLNPPAVQEFLVGEDGLRGFYPASPPLDQVVSQARIFVRRHGVQAVLVELTAPHGRIVADMFTAAFGQPVLTSGHFDLWRV